MRWCCKCAYDGTSFSGWQSQPNGNAIQDFLELRLSQIFSKAVRVHGSSRTDAGVHARGQIFHFDADWPHGPEKLVRAFRSGLPADIQVLTAEEVSQDFHARFSAQGKRYIYNIYLGYSNPFERRYKWSIGNKRVDCDKINELGRNFVGCHDFSAFAAKRGDSYYDDPCKTIYKLSVTQKERDLIFETEGSGYLYKMVRTLVGTLLDVGLNNLSPDYVLTCFEEKIRRERIVTAPACGLFLDQVFY